jgi:hypothetical protein
MSEADKKEVPTEEAQAQPDLPEAEEPSETPAQPDELSETPGDDDLDPDAQAVLDEVDVRDLLRSALAPPPGSVAPDLLHGVQRKLRRRSRGKFYGDGWSTARSPRSTYLVTSLLMLVLIGFVFLVLIPWGSGALP